MGELQQFETNSNAFSFNIGKKYLLYPDMLVLSKPIKEQLTYKEAECPNMHKIKMIKLFAIDETHCPICAEKLDLKDTNTGKLDIYYFTLKGLNGDRVEAFALEEPTLEIFDRINIKEAYEVSVATHHKGIFKSGIFIKEKNNIEKFKKDTKVQKSFLSKDSAIKEFMSNRPLPNYDWKYIYAWRQSLFLSMVHIGINVLTVSEVGFGKTEALLQMKDITDGAFINVPLSTSAGLIGSAIKDMSGSYHYEGGAIMSARNNTLMVDEVEKMSDYNYLRQLNTILANHQFTYRKANIFYENNEFYVSFIGMGNPRTRNALLHGTPKYIIDDTFKQTPEFLSRIHLIFAFRNKGMITDNIQPKVNIESLKGFVEYARGIVVKPPTKEIQLKISKLVQEYTAKTNDTRGYAKILQLCEAEAKLNLSTEITDREIKEIRDLVNITQELLYERA